MKNWIVRLSVLKDRKGPVHTLFRYRLFVRLCHLISLTVLIGCAAPERSLKRNPQLAVEDRVSHYTIRFTDGSETHAKTVSIHADTIHWADRSSGELFFETTNLVSAVVVHVRGGRTIEGAVIGAVMSTVPAYFATQRFFASANWSWKRNALLVIGACSVASGLAGAYGTSDLVFTNDLHENEEVQHGR